MAHWQLGHQDEARQWFAKAAARRDHGWEAPCYLAEAAALLGIPIKKPSEK